MREEKSLYRYEFEKEEDEFKGVLREKMSDKVPLKVRSFLSKLLWEVYAAQAYDSELQENALKELREYARGWSKKAKKTSKKQNLGRNKEKAKKPVRERFEFLLYLLSKDRREEFKAYLFEDRNEMKAKGFPQWQINLITGINILKIVGSSLLMRILDLVRFWEKFNIG